MSELKHLPAPWEIDGEFDDGLTVDILHDGFPIAEVQPHGGEDLDAWDETSIANARLIAAAPVLCRALVEIRTIKERIPFDSADAATECIRIAKEALKAIDADFGEAA